MNQIPKKIVDHNMRKLRGRLLTLIEAMFPEGQQDGSKRVIKHSTQELWHKITNNGVNGDTFDKLENEIKLLVSASLPADRQKAACEAIMNVLTEVKNKFDKLESKFMDKAASSYGG